MAAKKKERECFVPPELWDLGDVLPVNEWVPIQALAEDAKGRTPTVHLEESDRVDDMSWANVGVGWLHLVETSYLEPSYGRNAAYADIMILDASKEPDM